MKDNKKDKLIIIGSVVIALSMLIVGLNSMYEKGLYDGMNKFCDKGIGINENYEYVCYEDKPINENFGGAEWYLNTTLL